MSSADAMRKRAAEAVDAWNEKDLDRYYGYFADDVVFHGPKGIGELRGVRALRAQYDAALAFCPDLRILTKRVVVDPDAAMLASVQDEVGTSVDGKPFEFEGMTFFHFNADGLVDEVWEQFDIRS